LVRLVDTGGTNTEQGTSNSRIRSLSHTEALHNGTKCRFLKSIRSERIKCWSNMDIVKPRHTNCS